MRSLKYAIQFILLLLLRVCHYLQVACHLGTRKVEKGARLIKNIEFKIFAVCIIL